MFNIARVIFFVLGVIVCFSTNQFFKSCNKQQPAVATATPVRYDAIATQMLAPYDQRITELQTQNTALRAQVADIENSLSRTKRKAAGLERQLKEQISAAEILTDTTALLNNCDSLQQTALFLLDESAAKDSLYESLTGTLQQQVAIRDSTISVQAEQYYLLSADYNRVSALQHLATLEKEQFRTRYKKERTKSRLLTVGLAIIGGSAAYMLLHR